MFTNKKGSNDDYQRITSEIYFLTLEDYTNKTNNNYDLILSLKHEYETLFGEEFKELVTTNMIDIYK